MTTLRLDTRPTRAVVLPRDEMAFREIVTARIIRMPGSDERGVPPQFDDLRIPIRIRSICVSAIEALGRDAFSGSSPDVHDHASLAAHLHHIYGRPIAAFGNQVTRIVFAYIG